MRKWILRVLLLALAIAAGATTVFALIPGNMGGQGGDFWHWVAFVTLGLLSRLTFSRASFLLLWVALIAFGGAIELAQGLLNTMRDMNVRDLQVDALASFVGLVVGAVILALYRRLRDRNGTEAGV